MDREPTPVLLTREDDRLPLQRSLGTSAGRHLGAHVVDEHCDIADALDSYRAGFDAVTLKSSSVIHRSHSRR